MRGQEARIVISRGTTYDRLREQVADRLGGIVIIIGMGERPRKLLDQIQHEFPSVVSGESPDGREHIGVLHDGSLSAIAWHRDEPDKPPVFEVNPLADPQGMFRKR
jgi:hypothetical protein